MRIDESVFVLSEEEELIRETVAGVVQKQWVPLLGGTLLLNTFSRPHFHKAWAAIRESGFCGLGLPDAYGGTPASSRAFALMMQEMCRIDAGWGLSIGVNTSLVGFPLAAFGTEEQKTKWLSGVAEGRLIGCYGQTEPEAGSDIRNVRTKAVSRDGQWFVTGEKYFITNASEAQFGLILARTREDPQRAFTWFIVDFNRARREGTIMFERGKDGNEHKAGLIQSPTTAFVLQNAVAESMLGELHGGMKISLATLGQSRPTLIAGQALGIIHSSRDLVRDYTASRKQFNIPLNKIHAVSQMIREMEAIALMAELLTWYAACKKDQCATLLDGRPYALESSMAKLFTGEAAEQVASRAKRALGGAGYILDDYTVSVARFWQDSGVLPLYEGTSEIQQLVILRELARRGEIEYFLRRDIARGNPELSEVLAHYEKTPKALSRRLYDLEFVVFETAFMTAFRWLRAVDEAHFNSPNLSSLWHGLACAYTTLFSAKLAYEYVLWRGAAATKEDRVNRFLAIAAAEDAVLKSAWAIQRAKEYPALWEMVEPRL